MDDARQLHVILRAPRSEPEKLRGAEFLKLTNSAPPKAGVQTRHRAQASSDVQPRASLLRQPDDELLDVGTQEGQAGKAGMAPRA